MGKHHNTLGVPITATPDEIKKAYRKLCMVHHPDKGGNADTFLRIQEAYDSLTNNPVTEAPIFHRPPNQRVYNPFMMFIESYLQKGGDIYLHFVVNDMFIAIIYLHGLPYKSWSLVNKQDFTFIIPKDYLVKSNYAFEVEFNAFGKVTKEKVEFVFPVPRTKWQKFWDAVKKQF